MKYVDHRCLGINDKEGRGITFMDERCLGVDD